MKLILALLISLFILGCGESSSSKDDNQTTESSSSSSASSSSGLDVSNLHLTSPNDRRANPSFAWDVAINADGYEISTDGGLNWMDIGNVTSYTFSGLSDGNYDVFVRGYANVEDNTTTAE